VLEVFSSPGLEGIEAASGVNVASRIISNLVSLHKSWQEAEEKQQISDSQSDNEEAKGNA
jgi:hypothetical protein